MNYKDISNETADNNLLHEPVVVSKFTNPKNTQHLPCTYTDEEFKQILQEAENTQFLSDDVVKKMFASWL